MMTDPLFHRKKMYPQSRVKRCTDDKPSKRASSQYSSAEPPRKMLKVLVLKERSSNLAVPLSKTATTSSSIQESAVMRLVDLLVKLV